MIAHKVIKILAILLSLAAFVFFVLILNEGDEAIKINENAAQSSTVVPMMYVAYITLAAIIALVVVYVFINLFSSGEMLKRTLTSVGIMLAIILIAYYGLADSSQPEGLQNPTDDATAKMVGGALYTFYIIGALAVLTVIWSGVTRAIKR